MKTGKVLIVSEDIRDLSVYGGMLPALGYDVFMCSSYQEGAKRIETDDFNFAIVNQGGAAFEGRCVLKRAAELHLKTPILVVARCKDIHCYLEAMDLGAVDYLERPDPEDVEWEMESQLGHPHELLLHDHLSRSNKV